MSRVRKTVDVNVLKETMNEHLARTDEFATRMFKAGICTALEEILHESNQYRGFYFIGDDPQPMDEDYYSRVYF
jgi:hypothetical protein